VAFQDAMRSKFVAAVEELTGERVTAFLSQVHADPDYALEAFVLEKPAGDGAGEPT
jgi:DNA-binding MltR family transcriptional regulator